MCRFTDHSFSGGEAISCVSAVTVQGKDIQFQSYPIPASFLKAQLESLHDQEIKGIKIGMLPNAESVRVVASFLEKVSCPIIVLDPVLKTSRGESLCSEGAIGSIKELLFPLATLITPNLEEANYLTSDTCSKFEEIPKLAEKFLSLGVNAVLVKGGHLTCTQTCRDYLLQKNGIFKCFEHPHIPHGTRVRGTGCRLSSAITYELNSVESLPNAISNAIGYVWNYISQNIKQVTI